MVNKGLTNAEKRKLFYDNQEKEEALAMQKQKEAAERNNRAYEKQKMELKNRKGTVTNLVTAQRNRKPSTIKEVATEIEKVLQSPEELRRKKVANKLSGGLAGLFSEGK